MEPKKKSSKEFKVPYYYKPFIALFFLIATSIEAQENYATKLGFPANTKLLIIHADDLGMSHSENIASFEAMKNGSVNSGSIMMPAPWVLEVAEYANKHENSHDIGIHLVFSSEWKNYKMRPLSPVDKVPSLVDEFGFFHDSFKPSFNTAELEMEFKAQIDRAIAMGLNPSHLDVHMGGLYQVDELYEVYLKMGRSYNLPLRVPKIAKVNKGTLLKKYNVQIIVDDMIQVGVKEYAKGSDMFYQNALENLKPGLNLLVLHLAYDNEEMKGMTEDHPNWGSEWRQKDFDFFTSETCRTILKEQNIKLITWKQLKNTYN